METPNSSMYLQQLARKEAAEQQVEARVKEKVGGSS
jgi:hypothetical protein